MFSITNIKLNRIRVNPSIAALIERSLLQEVSMNHSFVHVEYNTEHPGVARIEGVVAGIKSLRANYGGLARVLLAGMAAALLLLAERLMNDWAESHGLVAWLVLWAVAFAALALLGPTARSLANRLGTALDGWARRRARRQAEERLWALAQKDPRVMAELQAARTRAEG